MKGINKDDGTGRGDQFLEFHNPVVFTLFDKASNDNLVGTSVMTTGTMCGRVVLAETVQVVVVVVLVVGFAFAFTVGSGR